MSRVAFQRGFRETYAQDDEHFVIKRETDIGEHLDACREMRNDPATKAQRDAHALRPLGAIPAILAFQWLQEGFNMFEGSEDCARELRKRLNSPEYAYLKTTDARL